jgi:hypothetical protein
MNSAVCSLTWWAWASVPRTSTTKSSAYAESRVMPSCML